MLDMYIDTKDPETVDQALRVVKADPMAYLGMSPEVRDRLKREVVAKERSAQ